jgi:hypothetical protein
MATTAETSEKATSQTSGPVMERHIVSEATRVIEVLRVEISEQQKSSVSSALKVGQIASTKESE